MNDPTAHPSWDEFLAHCDRIGSPLVIIPGASFREDDEAIETIKANGYDKNARMLRLARDLPQAMSDDDARSILKMVRHHEGRFAVEFLDWMSSKLVK